MEFTFLGGASEVGASCTLLEVAGRRLLIDGGMRPAAREGQSRLPDLHLLDNRPPEALLITHAHIDHTGALPLIASLYPHIPIYATESTRVLAEVLLRDSVRIMEQEQLRPDGETPLYSSEQVDALLARILPVGLNQPFAPISTTPQISVRFIHAGHILGAAMLYFETPEGTLLHTGDISVTDQRTIKGLHIENLPHADLMLCEGTYGNRTHTSRKEEERKLAETVQSVLAGGGRILCPAFAVGRAQEIVLILKAYRSSGQISPVPIYLDGMVRSVCAVYQNQSHDLHPKLQRFLTNARRPLFADPDLHIFSVRSYERADLIQRKAPAVVISSSGMLSGGASPLYALNFAEREQDCIMFTGYQDEESPGAALLAAKQGSSIRLNNQQIVLNCQVTRYNLSGHADSEQIEAAVTRVAPSQLILVHGSPEALQALARRFPRLTVHIPTIGTTVTIPPQKRAKAVNASTLHTNSAFDTTHTSEPAQPTLHDLWLVAIKHGAQRPWTSVELGQHYYGTAYRPAFRSQVEEVLKNANTHFKQKRLGAQTIYHPRPATETEQLLPLAQVNAGDIVLVQGQQGTPQIALLLSTPEEGTISLVGDQWKQGLRPINVIQLLPAVGRPEWLELPIQESKQRLQAWRKHIEEQIWVDVFSWWLQCAGRSFTFSELCTTLESDEQRLAWGLELLTHGKELFQREGMTWTSLDADRVLTNPGFAQHIALLQAGAGTSVRVNGQAATLTGRSNWRLFEIRKQSDEAEGTVSNVRTSNIELTSKNAEDS